MYNVIEIKPSQWKNPEALLGFMDLEFKLKGKEATIKILKSENIQEMFKVMPMNLQLLRMLLQHSDCILYTGNRQETRVRNIRVWAGDPAKWTPEVCAAVDAGLLKSSMQVGGLEFIFRLCPKEVALTVINEYLAFKTDPEKGNWWNDYGYSAWASHNMFITEVLRRSDLSEDERMGLAVRMDANYKSSPEMLGETLNMLGFNDEAVASILFAMKDSVYGAAARARFKKESVERRKAYAKG